MADDRGKRQPTRLAVAMHEAGHAVARTVNNHSHHPPGPAVKRVEIGKTSDRLGFTWMDRRIQSCAVEAVRMVASPEWLRLQCEFDVVETMAGPLAEWRWQRQSQAGAWLMMESQIGAWRGSWKVGAARTNDFQCIIETMTYSDLDLSGCIDRAVDLVWKHWVAIERVGRALASAGRLDGDAVERLASG